MSKYSYEYKKKIVQEYLNEKGSYLSLARKYKIGNDDQLVYSFLQLHLTDNRKSPANIYRRRQMSPDMSEIAANIDSLL